ncbi:MAG: DUF5615 family PIN-like protein [Chloroflexi bacterium]|nr:DUF5615 family PIN-like protein [Chloroflexota bacterium]
MDEDSMEENLLGALRARGVDVISALEVGMTHQDDSEHLEYATANGRVLCTFNIKHFLPLHTQYLNTEMHHAGMILAKQQEYSLGEVMRRILKLRAALSAEDMQDRAEFLSSWK